MRRLFPKLEAFEHGREFRSFARRNWLTGHALWRLARIARLLRQWRTRRAAFLDMTSSRRKLQEAAEAELQRTQELSSRIGT